MYSLATIKVLTTFYIHSQSYICIYILSYLWWSSYIWKQIWENKKTKNNNGLVNIYEILRHVLECISITYQKTYFYLVYPYFTSLLSVKPHTFFWQQAFCELLDCLSKPMNLYKTYRLCDVAIQIPNRSFSLSHWRCTSVINHGECFLFWFNVLIFGLTVLSVCVRGGAPSSGPN